MEFEPFSFSKWAMFCNLKSIPFSLLLVQFLLITTIKLLLTLKTFLDDSCSQAMILLTKVNFRENQRKINDTLVDCLKENVNSNFPSRDGFGQLH